MVIILVVGQIVEGGSWMVFGLGTRMVGLDIIIWVLKAVEVNSNVVGIVLRVNSFGGFSMVLDLI